MRRGFVYMFGLVVLFLLTSVIALVGVQGLASRVRAPVGVDALAITQTTWDGEAYVLYVGESVRRAECDVLPEVAQRLATSLGAEQSSLAEVNTFVVLGDAVKDAVAPRVSAYLKQHPLGQLVGFDYALDVDGEQLVAIADGMVELQSYRGSRHVGVYTVRPDVTVPLVYNLADIESLVGVLRELRDRCHGRYPKVEGADACLSGLLPVGFSAKRADASTVIISAPFRASCPSQVSLEVPLTVAAAASGTLPESFI